MKSMVYGVFAALALITSLSGLSGCSAIPHESAMEWMMRQPWDTLP